MDGGPKGLNHKQPVKMKTRLKLYSDKIMQATLYTQTSSTFHTLNTIKPNKDKNSSNKEKHKKPSTKTQ